MALGGPAAVSAIPSSVAASVHLPGGWLATGSVHCLNAPGRNRFPMVFTRGDVRASVRGPVPGRGV